MNLPFMQDSMNNPQVPPPVSDPVIWLEHDRQQDDQRPDRNNRAVPLRPRGGGTKAGPWGAESCQGLRRFRNGIYINLTAGIVIPLGAKFEITPLLDPLTSKGGVMRERLNSLGCS